MRHCPLRPSQMNQEIVPWWFYQSACAAVRMRALHDETSISDTLLLVPGYAQKLGSRRRVLRQGTGGDIFPLWTFPRAQYYPDEALQEYEWTCGKGMACSLTNPYASIIENGANNVPPALANSFPIPCQVHFTIYFHGLTISTNQHRTLHWVSLNISRISETCNQKQTLEWSKTLD